MDFSKLDPSKRDEVMDQVKTQLALANAQELLQVITETISR